MTDPATAVGDGPEGPPLGRELAARQRPLRARRAPLVESAPHAGPGTLGRRSFDFGLAAGLSLSSRREMGFAAPGLAVDGLPVVPPAEWDESFLEPARPRTGNATLDHIIATQLQSAAPRRPMPRRGLRATSSRRSTRAGRDTGPGASARRLRPEVAPMSRDLEIQRLVSGQSSDARPRAPRSGPQFSGGAAPRTPETWPGREARGRPGRPAPWPQQRGAHSAPDRAETGSVPPLPSDRSAPIQVAAGLAAALESAQGLERGASGLTLPRRGRALPPALAAPTSTAGVEAVGAMAPAARLAALAGSSPTRVESLPVAGPALAPASVSSSATPFTAAPGRGRPGTPAGTPDPATPARQTAPGSMSPAAAPMAVAAARRSGPDAAVDSVSAAPTADSGSAQPFARSRRTHAEPALAALLRAAPPALMLTSPPRRGFGVHRTALASPTASTPPGTTGGQAVSASSPVAPVAAVAVPTAASGGPLAPGGPIGATTTPMPRAAVPTTRASAPPGAVPAQVGRTPVADLPVGPGLVGPGAAPAHGGSPPSRPSFGGHGPSGVDTRPTTVAPASSRGLGTVAAITSPRPLSSDARSGSSMPAAPRRVGAGGGPGAAGPSRSTFTELAAPRAVRTLPDLGVVGPGLVITGATPTTSAAPPAHPGRGVPGAGTPPVGSAASSLPGVATRPASSDRSPGGTSRRAGSDEAPVGDPPGPSPSRGSLAPGSLPVSPPALVPADPVERFDSVLAEHAAPVTRPLPKRFEPIARSIVPRPDAVRISTGQASRAALAAVGKVAATSGDTVHLARPLDGSRAAIDILAHELTHVAHPSPAVRFYGDDRHSTEERLAREIGSVMAAAPVGTPPVTPPPAAGSGAAPAAAPAGRGVGPTAAGAAGGSAAGRPSLNRPQTARGTGGGSVADHAPVAPAAPPGMLDPTPGPGSNGAPGAGSTGAPDRSPQSAAAAGIDIDRLLDALEARVIRELERRGRRWPRPI